MLTIAIAHLTDGEPTWYSTNMHIFADRCYIGILYSSAKARALAEDEKALVYHQGFFWRPRLQGDELVLVGGMSPYDMATAPDEDAAWVAAALAYPDFFKRSSLSHELDRALVLGDAHALAKQVPVLESRSTYHAPDGLAIAAAPYYDGVSVTIRLTASLPCACCGRLQEVPTLRSIGGILYCKDCATANQIVECCGCGCAVLDTHDTATADGHACVDCYIAMAPCAMCQDLTAHTDDNGDPLCADCAGHSVQCTDCGRVVHEDDAQVLAGDFLCRSCYADKTDNLILPYSTKPEPVYHGSGLQLGLELEVSFSDPADQQAAAIAISEEIPEEIAYMKEDGSLMDGIEIVSHPHDLKSWHDRALPYYGDAIWRFSDFAVWGRDGIHIHVDRSGMTLSHQIKFAIFFTAMQEQLAKIADRRSSWAVYDDRPECGRDYYALVDRGDRYRATNFNNRSTVEVRIFRSTLHVSKIAAYLECVDAIYHFTRRALRMEIESAGAWKNFCKFLKYQEKYKNIVNLIGELGL